jgi:hypothetical protein
VKSVHFTVITNSWRRTRRGERQRCAITEPRLPPRAGPSSPRTRQRAALRGFRFAGFLFGIADRGSGAAFRYGSKYLKTGNDGEQPNNLPSLPECA